MTAPAGPDQRLRTGGQVLVDQLLVHGVTTAFCVPGESYLAATDALYDAQDIQLHVCRQEGGAGYMAEAYGKLTGRPGICFVTRGPGATNASVAVHTAFQDSTPMILFVGQVATDHIGREAFQELDYRQVFGGLAKWATQIEDAARIPEIIHRAFTTATSGRPGPVVVALPEDVLEDVVLAVDAPPFHPNQAGITPAAADEITALLATAERPLVVVGGSGWDQQAAAQLRQFSESWGLPVVTAFRRQDLVDHRSPSFSGSLGPGADPTLLERLRSSDLLVVIGARLGDMATGGYTAVPPLVQQQRLVHVHPSVEELGRVYACKLAVNAGPRSAAAALSTSVPPTERPWLPWTAELRAQRERFAQPPAHSVGLNLATVVRHMSEASPEDTIVTNGAGNYTGWAHRFYEFTQFPTQLGPTNGSMGYGLPAGIAAKIVHPDRTVIVMAGDGCFLMNGQELATAMRYDLAVIVVVVNNGHYGTIRLHQEKRYPGRVIGTGLTNPDFVAFAQSFGAHAERVTTTEEFPEAFRRAREAGRAALIEVCTDPDQSTPDVLLSDVRKLAQGREATTKGSS